MEHTAFVAGATGLVGRNVVSSLRQRGVRTVAHIRPDSSRRQEWAERFSALGAEVSTAEWSEEAIVEALTQIRPSFVFALLGTTRKRAQRSSTPEEETYEAVDYGLSSLLLKAARRSADADKPRFIYLSSMGVHPRTKNAYLGARAKLEAELEASGLAFAIVRPSFIVGDRDEYRLGENLSAAITDGALATLRLFGGKNVADRYRSIRGEELAERLVEIALDEAQENAIIEADELR